MNFVWRNGEYIDRSAATVSIEAAAVSYSHAVFDACRVVVVPRKSGRRTRARVFLMQSHIERFLRSCADMKLTISVSEGALSEAAAHVIQRNSPAKTCGLRWFALNEATSFASVDPTTVFVFLRSLEGYPSKPYRLALDETPRPNQRHLPLTVKAMAHYAAARVPHLRAKQSGFDDVVFVNESGRLTEASRASVLLLSGRTLFVPPVEDGLLRGITRELVQHVCVRNGTWNWAEQPIAAKEIHRFDAALICSSSIGVAHVSQIGEVLFGGSNHADEIVRVFEEATMGLNDLLSDCVEELPIS